jgi:drug/metabolite transporter (DMT)-like permease
VRSPSTAYPVAGIALAVAGVALFAFRPLLVKFAYGYVRDPVTLLALRMIFSLPFFLLAAGWSARGKEHAPATRRDIAAVIGLGFLGYYFSSFADFLGLQYVTAGIGRLILFVYPTIVVILSAVFLRKRPAPREVLALAVTYCGVALVLSSSASGQNENLPLGASLVFVSAVAYAAYLVASSQVVQRLGSIRFTAYAMTVASLLCIAQFLLLRPISALDLPAQVYMLAITMAVFATVLPVFMTSEALKRIGANRVAMIGALGPVTTIFFGFVGLDEVLTVMQVIGAVLVLAGVLLVTLKPASR